MKIPTNVPEKGFYYHYKHDSNKSLNNFAYELVGTGAHTEDDCRPEDAAMVVYRPLYEDSNVFQSGKLFYLRPLDMWMGQVTKEGKTFSRFQKINDKNIIDKLVEIRDQMYGAGL